MNMHHADPYRVVIVGGGLAGLETALSLRTSLGDRVDVTVVSRSVTFTYRPFLTYVALGLSPDRIHLDLRRIAEERDLHLALGRADRVDTEDKSVRVGSEMIPYDALVLATGARAAPEPIPGYGRGYAVWEEDAMLSLHQRMLRAVETASDTAPARIVFLIPPGAQWTGPVYELAMMMATWLRWKGVREAFDLRLVTFESRHLEAFGEDVHAGIVRSLAYHGILTSLEQQAVRVDSDRVVLEGGEEAACDVLVNAAVYRGSGLRDGLAVDEAGFYRTDDETRRVHDAEHVYAVGDGSDYPIKQGFLALLQADAAVEQIAARVLDREPEFTFSPAQFWLLDELDQVLFARSEGETDRPRTSVDRLPADRLRRLEAMGYPAREQRLGNPLFSGLLWKGTEVGLALLKQLEHRPIQ